MFLQTSVVLVSKSTPRPPCCPSPPRGDGSAYDQLRVLLSPSLLLSPFFRCPVALSAQRAIQSLDNYLMLAGLILPGLPCTPWEKGIQGKPFHCTAAAAEQQHGASQEGLQLLQTWSNCTVNNLLVSGLQSNYFKRAAFWVTFLYCILPQTCFFCMW